MVHGPWPRWVLQIGLIKLALRTAAVVMILCLVGVFIALAIVGRS